MAASPTGRTLTLATLAAASGGAVSAGHGSTVVSGIAYDSRRARAGDLFVALRGSRLDGNDYVTDALSRGAVAVASERACPDGMGAPWIKVPEARLFLARAAKEIYRVLPPPRLVGITGTKGKTTTAHALAHVLDACGLPAGLLGTVVYRLGCRVVEASRTTPEAPEIEQYLQEMTRAGKQSCAMEVSSHSLALSRVAALSFEAAVFTNLGRDHLDFHIDEERYFAAKRSLFGTLAADALAIVNADDARAADVAAATSARVMRFGTCAGTDVRIDALRETLEGVRFRLGYGASAFDVESPLLGAINAMNLAAAFAAAVGLGAPAEPAAAALRDFRGVPGRMEPVKAGQPFLCLVDYAHTPESLDRSLEACRRLAALGAGRVIVVMGCGGDRDRGKRPLMGATAVAAADHCVITSDNPRSEDPLAVILDVELGIKRLSPPRGNYSILPDRREAIREAISRASKGDVVLIAGKGHERTQTGRDRVVPFDDRQVAREEIEAAGGRT